MTDCFEAIPIARLYPSTYSHSLLNEHVLEKEFILQRLNSYTESRSKNMMPLDHDALRNLFSRIHSINWKLSAYTRDDLAFMISSLVNMLTDKRLDFNRLHSVVVVLTPLLGTKETKTSHKFINLYKSLTIDWKILWDLSEKYIASPHGKKTATFIDITEIQREKMWKDIQRMLSKAYNYYDPNETGAIIKKIMPLFSNNLHTEYFKGLAMLSYFVPRHATSLNEYIPEWFNVWSWLDNCLDWNQQWMKIFGRIIHDDLAPDFDWVPYLSRLYSVSVDYLKLPAGKGGRMMNYNIPKKYKYLKKTEKDFPFASFLIASLFGIGEKDEEGVSLSMNEMVKFLKTIDTFFYPSNQGNWTTCLTNFITTLISQVVKRIGQQRAIEDHGDEKCNIWLSQADTDKFIDTILPILFQLLYSKKGDIVNSICSSFSDLASISQKKVFGAILPHINEALDPDNVTQVHKAPAILKLLKETIHSWLHPLPLIAPYLSEILNLTLAGLDANDPGKSFSTLRLYQGFLKFIPMYRATNEQLLAHPTVPKSISDSYDAEALSEAEALFNSAYEATQSFEDWILTVLKKLFIILPTFSKSAGKLANMDLAFSYYTGELTKKLFSMVSPELFGQMLQEVLKQVKSVRVPDASYAIGSLLTSVTEANQDATISLFFPYIKSSLHMSETEKGVFDISTSEVEWLLIILNGIVRGSGKSLLQHRDFIEKIISHTSASKEKGIYKRGGKILRNTLKVLTMVKLADNGGMTKELYADGAAHWHHWGTLTSVEELTVEWHVPNDDELEWAASLLRTHCIEVMEKLTTSLITPDSDSKKLERTILLNSIRQCIRGASCAITWSDTGEEKLEVFRNIGDTAKRMPVDIYGLRQRLAQFVVNTIQYYNTKDKSGFEKLKEMKLLIKITKRLCTDYGFNITKVNATFSWKNHFMHKTRLSLMAHYEGKLAHLKDSETRPFLTTPRQELIDNLNYGHGYYITKFHSSVISALLEDPKTLTKFQELSRCMTDLCFKEYKAIRKDALNFVTSTVLGLGINHVMRDSVCSELIRYLKDTESTPEMLESSMKILVDIRPSTHIWNNWPLASGLMKALIKCHNVESVLPEDKKSEFVQNWLHLSKQTFKNVTLLDLNNVNDLVLYHDFMSEMLQLLKFGNLHWRYELAAIVQLGLFIRSDIAATDEIWMYIITAATDSKSNHIRHAALTILREKLFAYCLTNPDIHKMPSAVTELMTESSDWSKKFGVAIISDHPVLNSVGTSLVESWNAEAESMLHNLRPGPLTETNARYRYGNAYFSEGNVYLLADLLKVLHLQGKAEKVYQYFKEISLEMLTSDESHADLRNHTVSGAEICCALSFSLTNSEGHVESYSWDDFMNYLELASSTLSLEFHSDIDASGSLMSYRIIDSVTVKPLLDWSLRQIEGLAVFKPEANGSDDTNFAKPTKYLRLISTIISEIRAHDSLDSDLTTFFQNAFPFILDALGIAFKTCRTQICRFLLFTLQHAIKTRSDDTPAWFEPMLTSISEACEPPPEDSPVDVIKTWQKRCETILLLLHKSLMTDVKRFSPYLLKLLPIAFNIQGCTDPEINTMAIKICQSIAQRLRFDDLDRIASTLSQMSELIKRPNWHTRMAVLKFLETFRAYHIMMITEEQNTAIMELCIKCLSDEQQEVSCAARDVLAGILKDASTLTIEASKARFLKFSKMKLIKSKKMKDVETNGSPEEYAVLQGRANKKLHMRFAGVLGLSAIVLSSPYDIRDGGIVDAVCELTTHTTDPNPIGPTAATVMSLFKRTHADQWKEKHRLAFTPEQLENIEGMLDSPHYYA